MLHEWYNFPRGFRLDVNEAVYIDVAIYHRTSEKFLWDVWSWNQKWIHALNNFLNIMKYLCEMMIPNQHESNIDGHKRTLSIDPSSLFAYYQSAASEISNDREWGKFESNARILKISGRKIKNPRFFLCQMIISLDGIIKFDIEKS